MLHNNGTPEKPMTEVEQLEEAGKKGDVAAYLKAGWCYENAIGTKVDFKKATSCYEEATLKGSLTGRINVAYCYGNMGEDFNANGARSLVTQVASFYSGKPLPPESDDPDVNYARAVCYEYGFNVPKDRNKAVSFLLLAANKNHVRACDKLATAYRDGTHGLIRDAATAKKYYQIAVNENYVNSCLSLAGIYQRGDLGGVVDDKQIFELLKKVAEVKSTPVVLAHLIYYYSTNIVGTPDHKKALETILKGVEQNDAYCIGALGTYYENGYGVLAKDLNKACEYYQTAAALGDLAAKQALIRLGKNPVDVAKKSQPIEMKAANNSVKLTYAEGAALEENNDLFGAAKCFQEAAKENNPDALTALGWYYENGLGGIPRDAKKARAAYDQAKQFGNTTALARFALFKTMSTMPFTMNISYNDCEFGRVLGAGSFSTVFQAQLKSSSFDEKPEIFAVKKLKKCNALSFKFFEAEVKVAKMNINSPNVIKFVGVCMSPPFIAMEKAVFSLDDYMMKFDFNEKYYEIAQGIANGVGCLHRYGIIHRDIKPKNILLDENLTPKVADFDFAMDKYTQAERRSGTTDYKAPELFKPGELLFSEKSDVYALGMTFFSMVAKTLPFSEKKDSDEFAEKIQKGVRPAIPDTCPTPFADLIRECWRTDPNQRPTAMQVVNKLEVLKRNCR